MEDNQGNEIRKLSHLALVFTLTAFSILLSTLNIFLGWDKWTIPLCITAVIICVLMHVMHKPQENVRLYCYAVILLVELFYYCVNSESVYDSAPVITVVLIVLTMTQEKLLTWACIAVGYGGMIYHILDTSSEGGITFDVVHVVRTGWHLVLVGIAAMVVLRLMDVVVRMARHYEDKIEMLEGVNKSASDFLANVSHEIRTPVNAIIGLTGVCIEKESSAEIRESLQSVEQAGHRVAEQISDILDYSEIDMENLAVNEEEYMLSSILNDLVTHIRPIKPKGIELVIDVDPALPSVLCSDCVKLKKILWHLISNGLKYTQEGGVYVRISSVEETYGINLCIEVTDTGIGMSPEELERISERFYQANSGRTRSTSGLGLGMAIVSGFVYALHGFMKVDSEPGKGTTVHVSIPQKVVDPTECMSLKNRENLSLGAFLHFEKYANAQVRDFYDSMLLDMVNGLKTKMHKVETIDNLKKLVHSLQLTHLFVGVEEYCADIAFMEEIAKEILVIVVADQDFRLAPFSHAWIMEKPFYCFPVIGFLNMEVSSAEQEGRMTCPGVHALVVDDEPMNLKVARGIFQRYGMEVSTASSGQESIEMCRKNAYDIVFMDHMMPGMDGVEAMKCIRAEAVRSRVELPIVALTANAVSTAKEMFLSEGFDGFVSKPVERMELERVLKKVLPKIAIVYVPEEGSPAGSGDAMDSAAEAAKIGSMAETGMGTAESGNAMGRSAGPARQGAPAQSAGGGNVTGSGNTTGGGNAAGSAVQAAGQGSSAHLYGLLAYGIAVEKGLQYCQGDKELYRELLQQFSKEEKIKRAKLDQYLAEENLSDYSIIVHAIKSTAKMIGATALSDLAQTQERATKEGRAQDARDGHGPCMAEYARIAEGIRKIIGDVDGSEDGMTPSSDGKDPAEDSEIMEFEPDGEIFEFEPEGGDGV